MWGCFLRDEPVRSFADARTADVLLFKRFFREALARGVYLAPTAFEAGFMSAAHDDAIIDETLDRLRASMQAAMQAAASSRPATPTVS
jgi:glutamate-1-semialdehyde 2,1-aminomutase